MASSLSIGESLKKRRGDNIKGKRSIDKQSRGHASTTDRIEDRHTDQSKPSTLAKRNKRTLAVTRPRQQSQVSQSAKKTKPSQPVQQETQTTRRITRASTKKK